MTELASMGGDTSADSHPTGSGETRPPEPYVLADVPGPLGREELRRLDAWWRAANYLSVGQIYLMDNPLLSEPLRAEHVKPRLLGHFGVPPIPRRVGYLAPAGEAWMPEACLR
jgi:xylulose-5-phosphate/fructose-6-phosphate phosphoketolase